jgi:hypothetical protein
MTPEQRNCDHTFAEDRDPALRAVLGPCLTCGLSALDAIGAMKRERDVAGPGAEGRDWKTLALATVDDLADELGSRAKCALVLLDSPLGAPRTNRSLFRGEMNASVGLALWFAFDNSTGLHPFDRSKER